MHGKDGGEGVEALCMEIGDPVRGTQQYYKPNNITLMFSYTIYNRTI